jgi:hypothetical protein
MLGLLAFVPPFLLKTNIEVEYKDIDDKQFAKDALEITKLTLDNNLERLVILSYSVKINQENEVSNSAGVIAYTIFGIPYAVVEATPSGASIKQRWGND